MPRDLPKLLSILGLMSALAGCAISPETQAKIDAFSQSIPSCNGASQCQTKWQVARNWAIENSDFPILTESEDRVMATSTLRGMSGVGVTVNRVAQGSGYQLVVDVECFSAYGCPDLWDLKLDFNRVVNNSN